jgi:site-specific DNA-methyltransferase (adenine-specific)
MNRVFHGDCLDMLRYVSQSTVNLIMTSPPFAMQRRSSYGGVEPDKYISWFLKRAEEFKRVLTPDGSMLLNICPHTENGEEAAYVDDLKAALRETWYLIDTYTWRKTNGLGGRVVTKLKNGWEPCFHFALQRKPAFFPEQVRRPAAASSIERANRLKHNDLNRRQCATGSGLGINMAGMSRRYRTNGGTFGMEANISGVDGMAYPDNVIEASCETRNLHRLYGNPRDQSMASAAFPEKLPAFFIDLLTRKGDTVLDPFAGTGTVVKVAQDKDRHSIAVEKEAANIRLIQNRLADNRTIAKNTLSFSCSTCMEYLRTPVEIWKSLTEEFDFTIDACASHENHLVRRYFTPENDGLKGDWTGEVVYCHPLFDCHIGRWIEKAYCSKCTTVMLLPAATHTRYFHRFIYNNPRAEVRFLEKPKKGFRFGRDDGSPDDPSRIAYIKPLMVVIFRNASASAK